MLEQLPVSGSVRQLLDFRLRTDADLDAFCLDCFPAAYRRFGKGMERTEKVNLLLSLEEASAVATTLQAWSVKRQPDTSNQSWRLLVLALVLLGSLTAGALYVAISRLGHGANPPPATIPSAVTPPAPSIPRPATWESQTAAPALPASSTNSVNSVVDHAGDIRANGNVNIGAPSGGTSTLVKTRGQIQAGGDVQIGVTAPATPARAKERK